MTSKTAELVYEKVDHALRCQGGVNDISEQEARHLQLLLLAEICEQVTHCAEATKRRPLQSPAQRLSETFGRTCAMGHPVVR